MGYACWEFMSLLHFACYSPMELRGWRSLFYFFISVSLVTHIGRCDRSHPRANLIVHASQIQSGEGVSKDRECLILLPPTDLFPENPGIKWEASCGRVCRDISCLNRWPWGQGQEQAEVIGFPLQCSMKAAWLGQSPGPLPQQQEPGSRGRARVPVKDTQQGNDF